MFAYHPPAFALLTRSLREDNRLKQTYFARGGLICFILLMLLTSQNTYGYMGAPGLAFFNKVVFTNFFFITVTGLSYFAGAVAEEKEEGTLGLLRMTNLGPLTILLGKSSSRLLGIALLLLVQLPFTLLAVTLGGVSTHQVLAAYLALGAYIFFVCNLALLFSVICERVGAASVITGLALLGFFLVPAWGKALLDLLSQSFHVLGPNDFSVRAVAWGLEWFSRASVFTQLETILANGFAGPLCGFQVLSNVALGVFFFGLAWWGFDRFTRERRPGVLVRKMPAWRVYRVGMPGSGRAWTRAVWWKDFFLLHGGWNVALLKVAGFAVVTWVIQHNLRQTIPGVPATDYALRVGGSMVFMFLFIFGAEMAFGASRIFHAEVQGKTLAGLAGLPASMASVAYQKVGALLLSGAPALVYAALGWVLVLANDTRRSTDRMITSGLWLGLFVTGTQGLLLLHLTAYFSLLLKRLALAVAVAAMVVGNMLFGSMTAVFFRSGPSEDTLILYHCGLLALTAFLHVRIGSRLVQKAAEEG